MSCTRFHKASVVCSSFSPSHFSKCLRSCFTFGFSPSGRQPAFGNCFLRMPSTATPSARACALIVPALASSAEKKCREQG